ncbi:50S ribosomal protein L29 [Candidatus Micrarchaeota archaeon]|nr:50S ribosomal protein L29 [Candidatus Micrarchaeota archaeon]
MAIIQKSKLNDMTSADMEAELQKVRSEYRAEMAAFGSSGKPKNPGRYKELRRMVARLITKMAQKNVSKKK